jgi:HPt (histidine-containing phosphotransfer) domain-containing protein
MIMTGADEDLQTKLKTLQDAYRDKLDARLDEVDTALNSLRASDGSTAEDLDTLLALAHKLTGSAGTFGLPAVSDAAEKLETLCASLVDEGKDASAEMEQITRLVNDLRKAAEKETG